MGANFTWKKISFETGSQAGLKFLMQPKRTMNFCFTRVLGFLGTSRHTRFSVMLKIAARALYILGNYVTWILKEEINSGGFCVQILSQQGWFLIYKIIEHWTLWVHNSTSHFAVETRAFKGEALCIDPSCKFSAIKQEVLAFHFPSLYSH